MIRFLRYWLKPSNPKDPQIIYFSSKAGNGLTVRRLKPDVLLSTLSYTIHEVYDAYRSESGYKAGAYLRYTNQIIHNYKLQAVHAENSPAFVSKTSIFKDNLRTLLSVTVFEKNQPKPVLDNLRFNLSLVPAVIDDLYKEQTDCSEGLARLVGSVCSERAEWSDAQYLEFVSIIYDALNKHDIDRLRHLSKLVTDFAKVDILKGDNFKFNNYSVSSAALELNKSWSTLMPHTQHTMLSQLLTFQTGVLGPNSSPSDFENLTPLEIDTYYVALVTNSSRASKHSGMHMYDLVLRILPDIRKLWKDLNFEQQTGLILILDEMSTLSKASNFQLSIEIRQKMTPDESLIQTYLKHLVPDADKLDKEIQTYKQLTDISILSLVQGAQIYKNINTPFISVPTPEL